MANEIDMMVAATRNKQPFTHFISMEVYESCESVRGLNETFFLTLTLLHLKVGTMALLDQRERDLARELLMACKEQGGLACCG